MIKSFKIIAFLEGVSYLLLLFVAVPIKYMAGQEYLVKMFVMPHGLLFVAYLIMAFLLKDDMKWDTKNLLIVLVCSILPFGTFWMERKYLKGK